MTKKFKWLVNILITISLIIVTYFALFHYTQTQLTAEERRWCSPYTNGQIVVFKSNKGTIDTFIVEEKREFYTNQDCNWLEIGTIQKNTLKVVLKPKICHDTFYCSLVAYIAKDKDDEPALPFIRIFGLEYAAAFQNKPLLQKKLILSTSNRTYDSAFYFAARTNANSYGNNYLQAFYWDKSDGLIRYEGNNGDIFELLSK